MRKVKVGMVMILIVMLLVGCKTKVSYKFLNDTTEISSIEIVKVGDYNEQKEVVQTTICIIEDVDMFMTDFMRIACYDKYTNPSGMEYNSYVIKIIYSNDEYELISDCGTAKCTKESGFENPVSFQYFDKKQFEELILKYTGEEKE